MANITEVEKTGRVVGIVIVVAVIAFFGFIAVEDTRNRARGSVGSTPDDNGGCNIAYYCPNR